MEDLAMTAEKAARDGNLKQLYGTTKLSGKYGTLKPPAKNKKGKPTTDQRTKEKVARGF